MFKALNKEGVGMVQTALPLKNARGASYSLPESAEVVGVTSEERGVMLRFLDHATWGRPVRQVRLDRKLAEELTRLLNDELVSWESEL